MRRATLVCLAALLLLSATAGAQTRISYWYERTERLWVLTDLDDWDREEYAGFPIRFAQWVARDQFSNLPILPTGTSLEDLRRVVAENELRIVREIDDFLFIEGETTETQAEAEPSVVMYEFRDDKLVGGPHTLREAFSGWSENGYSKREMSAIVAANEIESEPADLNNIAWLLATNPDASARDADKAVEMAMKANEDTDWERPAYIDTLAAAYAIAGDFEAAVETQERAIARYEEQIAEERLTGDNVEAFRADLASRLPMYQEERIYTEPIDVPDASGESGNSNVAPQDVQAAALSGDARAQYRLARFYIANNVETAFGLDNPGAWWLATAAENGYVTAQSQLGYAYTQGVWGVEQDLAKAKTWLEKAAEGEDNLAAFNLARVHDGKYGGEINDELATQWYERAVEDAFQPAMMELAFRVGEGVGIEPDPGKKQQFLATLSLSGYKLPDFLDGEGISLIRTGVEPVINYLNEPKTQDEIRDRLVELAKVFAPEAIQGKAYVMWEYGDQFMAVDTKIAPHFASYFALQAARLGNAEAQELLADFYDANYGVEPLDGRAGYWRSRASNNPDKQN